MCGGAAELLLPSPRTRRAAYVCHLARHLHSVRPHGIDLISYQNDWKHSTRDPARSRECERVFRGFIDMRVGNALDSARAGCLGSLPRDVSAGARGRGCLPCGLCGAGGGRAAEGSWSQPKCAGRTATATRLAAVPGAFPGGEHQECPGAGERVVQGPGLPFEGPLGPGVDDQRRASDLLGDAGQGAARRGGNKAAGEGQARVKMPFCAARRVPVPALIRSRKTLSAAACGSSRIQAAAACRVMPGGRLGAMKFVDAAGVYFRGLVHAPPYQ